MRRDSRAFRIDDTPSSERASEDQGRNYGRNHPAAAKSDAVSRERPILLSGPMVRAVLSGSKTQTRRVVKAPGGRRLYDLSRAWVDHGFPTDDDGEVLLMERWSGGADPAPEAAYRNHYLHVPAAHPEDGWETDPKHDVQERVRCPYGIAGETRLWVRETWQSAPPGTHRDWPGVDDLRPRKVSELNRACVVIYRADGEMPGDEVWRPSIFMPRWASRITLELTEVRVQRLQGISELDCEAELGVEPYSLGDGAYGRFRDLWQSINGKRPGCAWADSPWVWALTFRRLNEKGSQS
jgi:hypothetical protein